MPKSAAAKRQWFQMTAAADGQQHEISLYGYIGESKEPQYDYYYGEVIEGEAGTLKEFQEQLAKIPDVSPIRLRIASEGGNAWVALAMHNMLASRKGAITCVIDGFAFSSASLIAMAADKIEMPQNAMMMIHCADWTVSGNRKDMESAVQSLSVMDSAMAKSYAAKAGKKPEDFLPLMEAETWLDGDQAKALGLVDVVTSAKTMTAHVSPDRFPKMPVAFRSHFDTPTNPNPAHKPQATVETMLRPRTPLFNAAVDPAAPAAPAAPAGGAAPAPAAPTAAAPAAPVAAAPAAPAAAAPLTLADIQTAMTAAMKPLQEKLDAQQAEITNLRQVHSSGAATAAQGAPPVSSAAPAAAPTAAAVERPTAEQMTKMTACQLIAIGRRLTPPTLDAPKV